MLKRKIDNYLLDWKNNPKHLPLIIRGARQIGKTTSILNFAKNNYKSVVEVNFYEHPEYKQIFNDGFSPDKIVKNLSLINPDFRFIENDTLIFFDEVQQYMDATTSLKFFKLDGRYDVICSGSALGINLKNVSSVSVGFKTDVEMFSLDFEEFLWALGYKENIVEGIENHILNLEPFSKVEMDVFSNLFQDYVFVGGMPAIVSRYIEQKNFSGILQDQKQIILDYDNDISKYANGLDIARIQNMYRHIASQLAKDNHKFQITKLGHGARSNQYVGCVQWLKDAGVINECYGLEKLSLPLKAYENLDNYRIYFGDSCLLVASLDDESSNDLRVNKNFGVYKGALYENIACEALRKQGYELYFYRSDDARVELDFLIRIKDCVVPLVIKSSEGKPTSLLKVINSGEYENVKYGIKFSRQNIGYENNIITLPLFTLFVLRDVLNKRNGYKLQEVIDKY